MVPQAVLHTEFDLHQDPTREMLSSSWLDRPEAEAGDSEWLSQEHRAFNSSVKSLFTRRNVNVCTDIFLDPCPPPGKYCH